MKQMIDIEVDKQLVFENVVSLRRKMKQDNVQMELSGFIQTLLSSGAKKNSPLISATHYAEHVNGQQVLDMEFLVSVTGTPQLPQEYVIKPVFRLVHAIYARHNKDIQSLPQTYEMLSAYMAEKKLQQITAAYNVNVNDDKVHEGQPQIIDIYIGVNPSIL